MSVYGSDPGFNGMDNELFGFLWEFRQLKSGFPSLLKGDGQIFG
jgi:hypothetical protein